MTVTAKCTPRYLISINALAKYLQIGLGVVVSVMASMPLCYPSYVDVDHGLCQSPFDTRSDAHGQAFVVVASAFMALMTLILFYARLLDISNMNRETNWRSVELFFNGVGFAVFALFGALETWYACGYFAGVDYISTLGVKTYWIVAAACGFANALIHLLTMTCSAFASQKD